MLSIRPFDQRIGLTRSFADAGLLPLRPFDERIGLTKQFADVLADLRHPNLIEHSFTDVVGMSLVNDPR